jgi:hypothetical protein
VLPALGGVFDQPVHFLCYEVSRRPGFAAAFADGSVQFIRGDTDEHTLRALMTRNGRNVLDELPEASRGHFPQTARRAFNPP